MSKLKDVRKARVALAVLDIVQSDDSLMQRVRKLLKDRLTEKNAEARVANTLLSDLDATSDYEDD